MSRGRKEFIIHTRIVTTVCVTIEAESLEEAVNKYMEERMAPYTSPAAKEAPVPGDMKPYAVTLTALSQKALAVQAVSPEAAMDLAGEMYDKAGVLNFTDDDVIEVVYLAEAQA